MLVQSPAPTSPRARTGLAARVVDRLTQLLARPVAQLALGLVVLALAEGGFAALSAARADARPAGATRVVADGTPTQVAVRMESDLLVWRREGAHASRCRVVDAVSGDSLTRRAPERSYALGSDRQRLVAVAQVRTDSPQVVVTCEGGGPNASVLVAPKPTAPAWLVWWGPFVAFPALLGLAGLALLLGAVRGLLRLHLPFPRRSR